MKLGMPNGVRLVSTVKPGRYAMICTETNVKRITRLHGRREAIRHSQHTASERRA